MDKKSYDSLIDLALDINVEVDIDSHIIIKKLNERIKSTKDKILKMETSLSWVWGESLGIDDIRVKVISSFLEKLGASDICNIEISKFNQRNRASIS